MDEDEQPSAREYKMLKEANRQLNEAHERLKTDNQRLVEELFKNDGKLKKMKVSFSDHQRSLETQDAEGSDLKEKLKMKEE